MATAEKQSHHDAGSVLLGDDSEPGARRAHQPAPGKVVQDGWQQFDRHAHVDQGRAVVRRLLVHLKRADAHQVARPPDQRRSAPQRVARLGEQRLRQALETARRFGDLSWELRAALALDRHLGTDGEAAYSLVGKVLDRFTEGFETRDLRQALARLGRSVAA